MTVTELELSSRAADELALEIRRLLLEGYTDFEIKGSQSGVETVGYEVAHPVIFMLKDRKSVV